MAIDVERADGVAEVEFGGELAVLVGGGDAVGLARAGVGEFQVQGEAVGGDAVEASGAAQVEAGAAGGGVVEPLHDGDAVGDLDPGAGGGA